MSVKYYLGRFTTEKYLFSNDAHIPNKDDFVFYKDETYKVLYVMYDYDHTEIDVFVRETVEEDFL